MKSIQLTIKQNDGKEASVQELKADMTFGVAAIRGNKTTEASVFLAGSTSPEMIINCFEAMSGAAVQILIAQGLSEDFVIKKLLRAVAEGAGESLVKMEKEKKESNPVESLKDLLKITRAMETLEKLKKEHDAKSDSGIPDDVKGDLAELVAMLKRRG